VRIEDWVIDLSHLMMHMIKTDHMIVTRMIAVHVRIEDWVIDLSHLMMHRIKTLIAMIAVSVSSFEVVEHLSSRIELFKFLSFTF
jgi:hypothetical protein